MLDSSSRSFSASSNKNWTVSFRETEPFECFCLSLATRKSQRVTTWTTFGDTIFHKISGSRLKRRNEQKITRAKSAGKISNRFNPIRETAMPVSCPTDNYRIYRYLWLAPHRFMKLRRSSRSFSFPPTPSSSILIEW